jgi:hypothetical protein
MLELVRGAANIQRSQPQLLQQMLGLAFVPTQGGQLLAPDKLYDPRVPDLAALLDPKTSFPAAPFGTDDEVMLTTSCHLSDQTWIDCCKIVVDNVEGKHGKMESVCTCSSSIPLQVRMAQSK